MKQDIVKNQDDLNYYNPSYAPQDINVKHFGLQYISKDKIKSIEELNEVRSNIGVFTPLSGNQTSSHDIKSTINPDVRSVQLDHENNCDKSEDNSFVEPEIKSNNLQKNYNKNANLLNHQIPYKVQSFVYSTKRNDKEYNPYDGSKQVNVSNKDSVNSSVISDSKSRFPPPPIQKQSNEPLTVESLLSKQNIIKRGHTTRVGYGYFYSIKNTNKILSSGIDKFIKEDIKESNDEQK